MDKKFYKYSGFWWTCNTLHSEPSPMWIYGPYCLDCQSDLGFPDSAYELDETADGEPVSIFKTDWNGVLVCELCGKKHQMKEPIDILKRKVSLLLKSNYRASLDKISLEEPLTSVKVRDEDDKYFISAKIGQKDGKRVGVVYFGEKSKDQNKKDYSQIFIDLDDEQLRFDKTNKHPKDILAKMKVEFPGTVVENKFETGRKKQRRNEK